MEVDYREAYRGRRVMVTGGLGFIGSNLARRLADLGADVLVVDSLIPVYGGNLFNLNLDGYSARVRVNVADIRTAPTMNYLVQGQDIIFNLAGQVSHRDSMIDPYTDLEINCRSQVVILEACRHYNPGVKIIFAGTRQQYGKADYLPVDERHLMHPTDVNGINKMAGEWYHILYNNVYGLRATSLRLTNTYGPRQWMKDERMGFISWFVRLAIEGRPIPLWGDGEQIRDLNYVDDVVEAFLMVGAGDVANGQIYNLGNDPVTLRQFVELLVEITQSPGGYILHPWPDDRKRIDIGAYYGNYGKISKELSWQPRVPLREGLTRMVAYYREHHAHYWNEEKNLADK
ncbi:MAG: NAD-dependent epimerase/dehydratase family protein [Acidobacteria bacterium]|nr:NAD-dependent epimerase/dehydratase family protein [Acidobacteriota bacterium]MBI3658573.1 NAD-dependent epimerase/dehydratase family protein [Acidobacteriota bacterium]